VAALKSRHMRNAGPLSKVVYDNRLQLLHNALGTHTQISRVQGGQLKSKREIRIAGLFRLSPPEFLLRPVHAHGAAVPPAGVRPEVVADRARG
jgi:predicted metal-dependent hydrolase